MAGFVQAPEILELQVFEFETWNFQACNVIQNALILKNPRKVLENGKFTVKSVWLEATGKSISFLWLCTMYSRCIINFCQFACSVKSYCSNTVAELIHVRILHLENRWKLLLESWKIP